MDRKLFTKFGVPTEFVGEEVPAADPNTIGKETPPAPKTPAVANKTPQIDENFNSDSEETVVISQKRLSELMGTLRGRFRSQNEKLAAEIEKLSQQATTTAEDKERIAKVLEQSRSQFTTELERQQAEAQRLLKEHTELKDMTAKEIAAWKKRYEATLIDNSVAAACTECGVFKPQQLRDMLDKYLCVDQAVDDKGNPLEEFKVFVNTKDDDGKPVKLPVKDFIQRMDQSGENTNLFQHNLKAGMNAQGGSSGSGGAGKPPTDPQELLKWLSDPANRAAFMQQSTT